MLLLKNQFLSKIRWGTILECVCHGDDLLNGDIFVFLPCYEYVREILFVFF